MSVTLRSIGPDDMPFLRAVYGSTREDELALTGWSPSEKDAFVTSQFNAQHTYYQANYAAASFQVILWEGVGAGRLYVARWNEEIRIVDIAILPEFRNRGVGTTLLQDLFAEADHAGKPIRIHVEKFNRALALYRRLGFVDLEDRGIYLFMEKPPRAR